MADAPTDKAIEILQMLKERHNVIVSGPPGTGKTRLLNQIARLFRAKPAGPVHVPGAEVPIPAKPPVPPSETWLPSPDREERAVFRTVFHQNTKYRDFVTGLVPDPTGEADLAFKVAKGTLYRASEFAYDKGAALLMIDEINRGPAIQAFGASIAAIESDKRLLPDNSHHENTQTFELLTPDGETADYALPHHLYLLAAMNQADTSVEPLDVAFLRRWAPVDLEPDVGVLASHFGLGLPLAAPPATPTNGSHIYSAAVRAWQAVNARITLGRGAQYQIGHGALMLRSLPNGDSVAAAVDYVFEGWALVMAHVDEVFFGDTRAVAAVLNVGPGNENHPFRLRDVVFADEPRVELEGPKTTAENLYQLLKAVAAP